jgi:hypothetical protein
MQLVVEENTASYKNLIITVMKAIKQSSQRGLEECMYRPSCTNTHCRKD